jgi:acetylornithine deacetylase/succinyl-diaminopimelate desuccinylase-like protein
MPPDDPFLAVALAARRAALGPTAGAGRWTFSTNGVATCGLHGIPTLGFGPASEIHAHAPTDRCPVDHLGGAIAFYATFIAALAASPAGTWRTPPAARKESP